MASLKDTARTTAPRCCGHWAGACIPAERAVMHSGTPCQHHVPSSIISKGKRTARGLATAGHRDRLRLPCAGRRARQPCPGRQGLKPRLFIAAAQLGLAASNHLLLLYSWPLVQLSAAAPPDRSGRSPHPDLSQQDLAGSLPASCLQHPACSSAPPFRPPGRSMCPGACSLPGWSPRESWAVSASGCWRLAPEEI